MDYQRTFSPSEISEVLGKSVRTIQRFAEAYQISKYSEGYVFSAKDVLRLADYYHKGEYPEPLKSFLLKNEIIAPPATFNDTNSDNSATPNDIKEAIARVTAYASEKGLITRFFTDAEWEQIISESATIEHQNKQIEMHQEQIQYLRKRIEKQDEILGSLSRYIEQRNFIEAKEKGYDSE